MSTGILVQNNYFRRRGSVLPMHCDALVKLKFVYSAVLLLT